MGSLALKHCTQSHPTLLFHPGRVISSVSEPQCSLILIQNLCIQPLDLAQVKRVFPGTPLQSCPLLLPPEGSSS